MNYLVQMKLGSIRPAESQEGIAFIEQVIMPTLELCKKLESEQKIVGGGPMSGVVGLALIVKVETVQELDDLITSIPAWPRMETTVTPLTSFDGRMLSVRGKLEQLKVQINNG